MRFILRAVLTIVIVGGLIWLGYENWTWAEAQLRGTFLADYKIIPLVLVIFVALSVLEFVYSTLEKLMPGKKG